MKRSVTVKSATAGKIGGGAGIRAVDAPPTSLPPGARRRVVQAKHLEQSVSSDEYDNESSSDVSPIGNFKDESSSDSVDESLWKIANIHKARKDGGKNADSLESADSSGRYKARKSVGDAFKPRGGKPRKKVVAAKLPEKPKKKKHHAPIPPPPSRRRLPKQVFDESDDDDDDIDSDEVERLLNSGRRGGGGRRSNFADDDDDDDDLWWDEDDDDGDEGFRYDPLEEETMKAVRKAKLLARIEQMEGKGIKASKKFNYKSNEDEMMVEVARMEVLAERSVRIEQGRAMLLPMVSGLEKGSNYVDRKSWLPFLLNLNGFSSQLSKNIDKFDDCLERGVAETIGPTGGHVWWIDLLWILIPSMVQYSFTNRMTENPAYANEVLRNNPEFQAKIAEEMAKELTHTEKQRRKDLEDQLAEARAELEQVRGQPKQYRPSAGASSRPSLAPAPPTVGNMVPPKAKVPTSHPLGDYPVDESATREMQQFILSQQMGNNQSAQLRNEVRQQVQQGIQDINQNLREEQRRNAVIQQKRLELEEEKLAREQQVEREREKKRQEPTTRPRIPSATGARRVTKPGAQVSVPPPPSQRMRTTIDLNSDDESSVDSL